LLIEANNLRIRKTIASFETKDETCQAEASCSIVVKPPDNDLDKGVKATDKNANRLSIASTSSAESSRSDINCEGEDANQEHGTSTFYVVWD
jgi:type IV secretory pathway VirD2 relaxase